MELESTGSCNPPFTIAAGKKNHSTARDGEMSSKRGRVRKMERCRLRERWRERERERERERSVWNREGFDKKENLNNTSGHVSILLRKCFNTSLVNTKWFYLCI